MLAGGIREEETHKVPQVSQRTSHAAAIVLSSEDDQEELVKICGHIEFAQGTNGRITAL